MNNISGNVTVLKFTAFPCPESISGNNAVINTKITINTLNAIIRCLNFNENSPTNLYNRRKSVLRQQCRVSYLDRGIE